MACELSSKWQLQPLYRPGRGGRGREQKVPCLCGDGFESYSVALQNAATTNKKLPVMACKYICCTTKWWLKREIYWLVGSCTNLSEGYVSNEKNGRQHSKHPAEQHTHINTDQETFSATHTYGRHKSNRTSVIHMSTFIGERKRAYPCEQCGTFSRICVWD